MERSKLRILLVDDIAETRENVRKLLQFESGIAVVGEASNGEEALQQARRLQPDCILMDVNMPGMDGIQATELINQELPHCAIIIISVQSDPEYLRKAMVAGARDYLAKPFGSDELVNTVYQVWDVELRRRLQSGVSSPLTKLGKVITVFSAKGGVGKTTLSTNLAVSLAKQGKDAIVMDLDMQFGDVPIMLNVKPIRTIIDWYSDGCPSIEGYLLQHSSGIRVLAPPEIPEEGEMITAETISQAIGELKLIADYIIIDTPQFFHETTLQSLELADEILLIATPDLPNLKNVRRCLDVLDKLRLGDKVKIVVNRIAKDLGLSLDQFIHYLHHPSWRHLPNDIRPVVEAANQGNPVVVLHPRARISQGISNMAHDLSGDEETREKKKKFQFFQRSN